MRAIGALSFVSMFFLFSQLSSAGLPSRDAGELTSAAVLLGVAHETGFPLYCLLVKGASLLPIGEIAWRAALVSAACGALAAACLASLVSTAVGEPVGKIAGGAAAALFCATGVVFQSSTVAEVYAPTAAALAIGLRCFQRAVAMGTEGAGGDRRCGLLLFFLVGLSLSLHASLRLLCVPAALFVLLQRRAPAGPGRAAPRTQAQAQALALGGPIGVVLLLGLGLVLPLLIVAYLPLRAGRGDLGQFGDPGDLVGLLRHLSAARIRAAFADRILTRDLAVLGRDLRDFCGLIAGQMGAPALLLSALGLGWLCRRPRTRPMALCLASLLLADVLYAAWINPMGIADWQVGTPSALALSALAGIGVGAAASTVDLGPRRGLALGLPLGLPLGLIVVLPAAIKDAPIKLGGRAAGASRFARRALTQVPPRGLLLPISDDLAAAARYEQGCAGDRPDVTVVVRQLAWDPTYLARATGAPGAPGPIDRGDPGWLPPADLAAFAHMTEGQRARAAPALLRYMASRAPTRVAWEPHPSDPPPGGLLARPGVPVFTLQAGRQDRRLPDPAALPGEVAALLAEPAGWTADPLLLAWGARSLVRAAEPYLLEGDRRAAPLVEQALRLAPDFDSAWIAAGVLRAQAGDLRGALDAVGRVLARDPAHPMAARNAALYQRRLQGERASPGPR